MSRCRLPEWELIGGDSSIAEWRVIRVRLQEACGSGGVTIETLEIIEGELPTRAFRLVREWPMMPREELLEDWRLCRENRVAAKIEPLG